MLDEFYRNEHILQNAQIMEVALSFKAPSFLKKTTLLKKYSKIEKELSLLKDEAQKEYQKRLESYKKKVEALFNEAQRIDSTTEIVEKANRRILKGNPPDKTRGCIGDAISWETLLEHYSNDDMIIVTRDSDFFDKAMKPDKEAKINPFLEREWKSKHNKSIKVCYKFSDLISLFSSEKEVNKKEIKKIIEDETIFNNLATSGAFSISSPSIIGTNYPIYQPNNGYVNFDSGATSFNGFSQIDSSQNMFFNSGLNSAINTGGISYTGMPINNQTYFNSFTSINNQEVRCAICNRPIGTSTSSFMTSGILCSDCSSGSITTFN